MSGDFSKFSPKTLTCKDCHEEFIFTEEEQEHFAANNWPDPVRCKPCRKVKKEGRKDVR